MRKYSDRDFQVNEISYNPSGNYKNENARKQVIEEKVKPNYIIKIKPNYIFILSMFKNYLFYDMYI